MGKSRLAILKEKEKVYSCFVPGCSGESFNRHPEGTRDKRHPSSWQRLGRYTCVGLYSPLDENWNYYCSYISTNSKWELDLQNSYLSAGQPILSNLEKIYKMDNIDSLKMYSPVNSTLVTINDILISIEELRRFETTTLANGISAKIANDILDANHKYYSKELAMAIKVWQVLYGNDKISTKKSHKEQIKKLLGGNGFSNSAIDRIATVVNPNKEGGAPTIE